MPKKVKPRLNGGVSLRLHPATVLSRRFYDSAICLCACSGYGWDEINELPPKQGIVESIVNDKFESRTKRRWPRGNPAGSPSDEDDEN